MITKTAKANPKRIDSINREDSMTYSVVVISLLLNYLAGYLITNDWIWSLIFVLLTFWIFIPIIGVILSPLAVLLMSSKDAIEQPVTKKEIPYPLTQGALPILSKRLQQDNYERNKKGTT